MGGGLGQTGVEEHQPGQCLSGRTASPAQQGQRGAHVHGTAPTQSFAHGLGQHLDRHPAPPIDHRIAQRHEPLRGQRAGQVAPGVLRPHHRQTVSMHQPAGLDSAMADHPLPAHRRGRPRRITCNGSDGDHGVGSGRPSSSAAVRCENANGAGSTGSKALARPGNSSGDPTARVSPGHRSPPREVANNRRKYRPAPRAMLQIPPLPVSQNKEPNVAGSARRPSHAVATYAADARGGAGRCA